MTVPDMPSQMQQIGPGDGDQRFLLGKNFNGFFIRQQQVVALL